MFDMNKKLRNQAFFQCGLHRDSDVSTELLNERLVNG
jgi:hypothetical protein